MFSAYSDMTAPDDTTGAPDLPGPGHPHRRSSPMSIETSIGLETGQPYPYRRTELVVTNQ